MYRSKCSCGNVTPTTRRDWCNGKLRPRCSACGLTLETRGGFQPKNLKAVKAKRPPKRRRHRLNTSGNLALARLQALRETGVAAGVFIDQRTFSSRFGPALHVMFNNVKGKRLADYWPGTGTLRTNTEATKVKTADEALEVAVRELRRKAHQATR